MTTIKTAISMDETLFERVERLAHEMEVSHSRLFAMTMEEYIQRRDYQKLQDAINEAHRDGPAENELAVRRAMRQKHRQAVERQW